MQGDIQITKLGDLASFEMGQSPDSSFVSDRSPGIPFLQGNAEFGAVSPSHKLFCSQPRKTCLPGDILISVRAPVGALNKADQVYCIGRGLAAVRFHKASPGFGWHLLSYWAENLRIVAQGTTFEAVGKRELQNLEVSCFPEMEQRRIAEMLDTVDAAIQQTEALIARLKLMKAGLLHDLLTRGLDEHGHLRNPGAHPEQFKDSPLGRIPGEWEVGPIQQAATQLPGSTTIGPFGSDLLADDYRTEGVPVIFVRDIKPNTFEWNSNVYVESEKARQLSAHLVEPGDLLATKMGLPPCISCVYPSWMPTGVITADIIRLRPNNSTAIGQWLSVFVNSDAFESQVRAITGGVTRPKVTLRDFRGLLIALPVLHEQKLITSLLDAHDARIRAEEAYGDKLKHLKQGLMRDLLTGRVRVQAAEAGG